MKEKLSGAFKSTPERFCYVVESSVNEAVAVSKKQNKFRKSTKVVVAVLLLLAIIPTAVFGAAKLFGVKPQKVGNYGISFSVCMNENAPQYIKMKMNLPGEFCEVKNSAKSKFHRTSNDEHAFTILPMKITKDIDLLTLESEVSDFEELSIASHKAYKLISTKDYKGLDRFYIWYEDFNILMLVYRGKTITDSEFEAFVNGITFVEATKDDHDGFYEANDNKDDENIDINVDYEFENTYLLTDTSVEFVFTGYSEQTGKDGYHVKSKISDIRIADDAKDISKAGINTLYDYDKAVDENGRFYPRVTELYKDGDGVNTSRKLISSSHVNQKLILADITYTNTTDKELTVYVPHRLETLRKITNGIYDFATAVDRYSNVFANSYCDGEIFYMSVHGDSVKDFYSISLKSNETKTITIGFRCNEDQLDNAYLTFSAVTDGVITPQPDAVDSDNTYYIFKVN